VLLQEGLVVRVAESHLGWARDYRHDDCSAHIALLAVVHQHSTVLCHASLVLPLSFFLSACALFSLHQKPFFLASLTTPHKAHILQPNTISIMTLFLFLFFCFLFVSFALFLFRNRHAQLVLEYARLVGYMLLPNINSCIWV
jgi:hypothetical protein